MKTYETSIVFTGDIGFDKYMNQKWEDDQLLSDSVLKYFQDADYVCANVEGALFEVPEDDTRDVCFHAMNPKATKVLRKMQADIWNIGNNHIMDAGIEGLISTKEIAQKEGFRTVGAGCNRTDASEPVYLDEAGGIGILSVTYMAGCVPATDTEPGIFRWDEMDYIADRIKEIKSRCRWCVVVSHGGEEFAALPLPYTRNRYLKYLEMGADVVVGHHPHVPENYELLDNGKAIFYSLGNFIFDTDYQRAHMYTDTGVLLKLSFTENKMTFDAIGVHIDRNTERLDAVELPEIFTNIPGDEYSLLAPLSAKALIAEDMRVMRYLEPKKFVNCSDSVWDDYYDHTVSSYCTPNAHMDYDVILPLAQEAEKGLWITSKLDNIKNYILRQFELPYPITYRYTHNRLEVNK